MEICPICGKIATELHHRIFRSQCKPLVNCKLNHIHLCEEHHRGTQGVHGKNGHKLDRLLKLQFQNNLEILFDKQLLTREEINEVLQISENNLIRLLKTVPKIDDKYIREEVIRQCCGGKLIIEGDANDTTRTYE